MPFSKYFYSNVLFRISQLLNIRRGGTELQGRIAWRGHGELVSLPEYVSQLPPRRAILHTKAREVSPSVTGWALRDHSAASAGSHQGFQASPTKACVDVATPPLSLLPRFLCCSGQGPHNVQSCTETQWRMGAPLMRLHPWLGNKSGRSSVPLFRRFRVWFHEEDAAGLTCAQRQQDTSRNWKKMKVSSRLRTWKACSDVYCVVCNRQILVGGRIPMDSVQSEVSPDHSYSDGKEIRVDSLSTKFSHWDLANSSVPRWWLWYHSTCWVFVGRNLLQCQMKTSVFIGRIYSLITISKEVCLLSLAFKVSQSVTLTRPLLPFKTVDNSPLAFEGMLEILYHCTAPELSISCHGLSMDHEYQVHFNPLFLLIGPSYMSLSQISWRFWPWILVPSE